MKPRVKCPHREDCRDSDTSRCLLCMNNERKTFYIHDINSPLPDRRVPIDCDLILQEEADASQSS